jgi:hypothetical protein
MDLKTPKTITVEATGEAEVGFRYFRVNFTEVLQPGDKVVLSAVSSEEAAYYLALNDAEKGITVTAE